MNNRCTRSNDSSSSFHRYLKPGALARLRDSKINTTTRSHRISVNRSLSLISSSVPASPPVDYLQIEEFPCFSGRIRNYGPRFPQRKKLVAARSMLNCYLLQPASHVVSDVDDLAAGADVAAH